MDRRGFFKRAAVASAGVAAMGVSSGEVVRLSPTEHEFLAEMYGDVSVHVIPESTGLKIVKALHLEITNIEGLVGDLKTDRHVYRASEGIAGHSWVVGGKRTYLFERWAIGKFLHEVVS